MGPLPAPAGRRRVRRRAVERDLRTLFARQPDVFKLADIEELAYADNRYAVITAFDVLEHVPQPGVFLDALVQLLSPSGLLFISTPDAGSVTARLMRRYWHHYNQFHLSVFSEKGLTRAVADRRLDIVCTDHRSKYFSAGYVSDISVNSSCISGPIRRRRGSIKWRFRSTPSTSSICPRSVGRAQPRENNHASGADTCPAFRHRDRLTPRRTTTA